MAGACAAMERRTCQPGEPRSRRLRKAPTTPKAGCGRTLFPGPEETDEPGPRWALDDGGDHTVVRLVNNLVPSIRIGSDMSWIRRVLAFTVLVVALAPRPVGGETRNPGSAQ